MSSARRAAVLPLAVAVGGVLLASVPAFGAVSAKWAKPTNNATYTRYAAIEFSVTLERTAPTLTNPGDGSTVELLLSVPGPRPGPFRVDTSSGTGDKDLHFTFTPTCPNHEGPCAEGSAPAYNGRYTARVSAGSSETRTIVLQVPPSAPTGVVAEAVGQHRVKVSWAHNPEPDVTGYDVFKADGATVATNIPADRTSHEFDLPDRGYGGEHQYMVRAHRLACANCDSTETLASTMSAKAAVTLTEPTPSPDPGSGGGDDPGTGGGDPGTGGGDPGTGGGDPGTGGGDGGYNGGGDPGSGTGGNGTGGNGGDGNGSGNGTTDENGYNTGTRGDSPYSSGASREEAVRAEQQRLAFGLTFKSFAPKLGAPKLPPLPQFAPPAPEEIPWGTYDPTLNYGDQTVLDTEQTASGGGLTSTVVETISLAFEGRKLYSSIAAALLMLLAAAHLRLWLRMTPTA